MRKITDLINRREDYEAKMPGRMTFYNEVLPNVLGWSVAHVCKSRRSWNNAARTSTEDTWILSWRRDGGRPLAGFGAGKGAPFCPAHRCIAAVFVFRPRCFVFCPDDAFHGFQFGFTLRKGVYCVNLGESFQMSTFTCKIRF